MVDKDHQYRFVYKALYEYWSKKQHQHFASPVSSTYSRYSIEEAHEELDDSFDDDDNERESSYSTDFQRKQFSFAD